MQIFSKNITVSKTARYFIKPSKSLDPKTVWLLIHGYAQLALDFINEFDFIKNEDHLLIAPEGLSRFYSRSRIGASWMTKEDRENEINDYINYLNSLIQTIKSEYPTENSVFNLLGFSQGVHTAARFFINGDHHFNNLILCSSDIPKDADFENLNKKLLNSKMFFIYGTTDSAISNERYDESIKLLIKNNVTFEDLSFSGDHVLNKKLLSDLFCK